MYNTGTCQMLLQLAVLLICLEVRNGSLGQEIFRSAHVESVIREVPMAVMEGSKPRDK